MNQLINRTRCFISSYDGIFWLIMIIGVTVIATSYPMMKLRFDIWEHIDQIRNLTVDSAAQTTTKRYWYVCWAFVFRLFNVTDLFTIGTVVHRVQFILNCLLIYVSVKQIFAPLLSLSKHIPAQRQWLSALALSSVAVWLTIIGTYSFFQQAWIMWYSVNYQITLSLLFLALSLSVNVLVKPQVLHKIILKVSLVFGLLFIVLLFHAAELAYLALYIPILFLCFGSQMKKKQLVALLLFLAIFTYVGIQLYVDRIPALLQYINDGNYTQIIIDIKLKGTWNAIHGGNRYSANWNELYVLSVCLLALITMTLGIFTVRFKAIAINKRVLWFLALSLVFCFAPTFVYTAGLLSLVSYEGIVNRYYFASFVYMALPLVVYIGLQYVSACQKPVWLLVAVGFCMFGVYGYSKIANKQGVYYQNVQSIVTSTQAKKINIDVHENEVESIGWQLQEAEKKYAPNTFVFCGAYESLHLAYYVFGRKNLKFERMGNHTLEECYTLAKQHDKKAVYLY